MNSPAIVPHLQAAGADIRAVCDALDDAESVRGFLRNMHDALPASILAFQCIDEDRIQMSPQFRALSADAKTAVRWAMFHYHTKFPSGRLALPISDEDLKAAVEFCRQGRDSVDESDDVWATLTNAHAELCAVQDYREQEADALGEWNNNVREYARLGYRREA
jgi:hypothetical protein